MTFWDRVVRVFRSRYVLSLEERLRGANDFVQSVRGEYEERIEKLEEEKSRLLDRVLLLTTGAPLVIPDNFTQPEPASSKNTDEINPSPKSFSELLAEAESLSFQKDLEQNGIPEEIVENAELTNALRAADEVTGEQQAVARKQFIAAFDSAKQVYLEQIHPVLTSVEQKESGKAN